MIADKLTSLRDVFEHTPRSLGFDIECKYPMIDDERKVYNCCFRLINNNITRLTFFPYKLFDSIRFRVFVFVNAMLLLTRSSTLFLPTLINRVAFFSLRLIPTFALCCT